MDITLETSWKQALKSEFTQPYFQNLVGFVKDEYNSHRVFPSGKNIFRALDLTPLDSVKVVILGQDPYHTPGAAMGLAFSVPEDHGKLQPSLQNIFKELHSDTGEEMRTNSDLTDWALQGVLLLNSTLTVRAHQAGSHQKHGWEEFTDAVIKIISEQKDNIVFILWGKYAQDKGKIIDKKKHLVIESPHPSPFSANRGFFGSKPFSQANKYLTAHNQEPIDWSGHPGDN